MADDYRKTLNLPTTNFPMKADLAKRELEILNQWQTHDIYQQLRQQGQDRDQKKFIVADGPPFANGEIHLGHALNKILKDIILKSKTLSQYDTPFILGFDCHGLPIEHQVEKQQSITLQMRQSEPLKFIQACRDYSQIYLKKQLEGFKRLGVFADFDNYYTTADFGYEAAVVRSLAKIYHQNYLTWRPKPVHWCVNCGSALADAELEYQLKQSYSIDVLFQFVDANYFNIFNNIKLKNNNIFIVIWTTTPWTLPMNRAVAINPAASYSLIEVESDNNLNYLIIAEKLIDNLLIKKNKILTNILGEKLLALELYHPFLERKIKIIAGDHVTLDVGTGAVHTAPAHGVEDYLVGLKYNLSLESYVNPYGRFDKNNLPNLPTELKFLENLTFKQAEPEIINVLKHNNRLLLEEKIEHSYPHCWRHKTPVILRLSQQWFIDLNYNNLLDKITAMVSTVTWHPASQQQRMREILANRPDWCLSRQRVWGVPMAFLIDQDSGQLHPETENILYKIADLIEHHGIEIWQQLTIDEILKLINNKNINNINNKYFKSKDILDVWFESGVMHQAVLNNKKYNKYNNKNNFIADLYLEGVDQYRGWLQSSLITAAILENQPPYRQVLTHGFVVDANGQKMSKSLGNVITPAEITEKFGADILRLWVAQADYTQEISISFEIINQIIEKYRRLRNTLRFLLSNLYDFNFNKDHIEISKLLILDRWLIEKIKNLQENIIINYNNYNFNLIVQQIYQFCTVELGGFYLDIVKDRLYTFKKNSVERRSCQTAIYYLLEALVRWLAPICPFTAEEAWSYLDPVMPTKQQRSSSIFLDQWYDFSIISLTSEEIKFNFKSWDKLIEIKNQINQQIEKLRINNQIGSSLEAEVTLSIDSEDYPEIYKFSEILATIFIVSEVKLINNKTNNKNIEINIVKTDAKKCERCWRRDRSVGLSQIHPLLCTRCIENLE